MLGFGDHLWRALDSQRSLSLAKNKAPGNPGAGFEHCVALARKRHHFVATYATITANVLISNT
jgi:hypothetical protein